MNALVHSAAGRGTVAPASVLHFGDCLDILPQLPSDSVDALITDPPYSSGGFTRSDRMQDPDAKYTQTEHKGKRPSFSGDNRDQRSWKYWIHMWLAECRRIVKPGGYALMFTDWRQLPSATDAFQAAGWQWRGIISWDKGPAARAPHKGYFRTQSEFVIWGTNGPLEPRYGPGPGPWPGAYTIPVKQADKHHLTGKPTPLLRKLCECVPAGAVILDPFMGSGTTGVACRETGRAFIGCDDDQTYYDLSTARISKAQPQNE